MLPETSGGGGFPGGTEMRFGRARLRGAVAAGGLAALAACGPQGEAPEAPVTRVRGETVRFEDHARVVTLTGEVQAREQSSLSFRVGGRMIERDVDVGDHVLPDQVLAKIDPAEQEATVAAALASVRASEALLKQVSATYERQRSLLERGFTTRRDFEAAEEAWRTAQGSLDGAQADLETALEQRADTVLLAPVAGSITERSAEVGQVVQAAEPVFALAHDGPRDAVFMLPEIGLSQHLPDPLVTLALVGEPGATTTGRVREVAPIVDPATGTVRVKISIEAAPRAMGLGAAVIGSVALASQPRMVLPWEALTATGGSPAVWIVDPADGTVSLRPIEIDRYDVGTIVVAGGLEPGETVVTSGAQLLRPEQRVALIGAEG
jgi:RND family efflux transporter MFP subunit